MYDDVFGGERMNYLLGGARMHCFQEKFYFTGGERKYRFFRRCCASGRRRKASASGARSASSPTMRRN